MLPMLEIVHGIMTILKAKHIIIAFYQLCRHGAIGIELWVECTDTMFLIKPVFFLCPITNGMNGSYSVSLSPLSISDGIYMLIL